VVKLEIFGGAKKAVNAISVLKYESEPAINPTYEEGLYGYDKRNYLYGGERSGGMSHAPVYPGMDGETT
jgi:hypothetical protein